MAIRLRGDKDAFWNNIAVGVGGISNIVDVGREVEQVGFFVTVSAATTITIQVAHEGDVTSEGILPEGPDTVWFDLFYTNNAQPVQLVFAAAGSAMVILPDVAFMHCRLKSSAAATITAGWQGSA